MSATANDLRTRALTTAQVLLEAAEQRGMWVSPDNRVGLQDAAALVGVSHGSLRNRIAEGKGPKTYRFGGGGHRQTVRVLELAEWLESHYSR